MAAPDQSLKKIVAHAKEYGFIFQSSEIYEGLQAVYDYGQNGVELKNNLKSLWWKTMVQLNGNITGLDSAIFMHPTIWQASGHLESFNDPMIDNKDSKRRYRADNLIEDLAEEYEQKGDKQKAQELLDKKGELMENNDLKGMYDLIVRENIKCPESGTCNWTEVRQFNLMFETQLGSVADESSSIYLRPETAQGIFVNFANVQKTGRMKIPFGIAQTGKAFRNEIVARQFTFRTREFEQMEMQFFVRPGEEMDWYHHWREQRMKWYKALGIPEEHLKFHDHEDLAHYANAAVDIEYNFPIGFKEVEGIHSRTDFDLSNHEKFSNKKLHYHDEEIGKKYIPYVVETSAGLDRLVLMLLCHAYTEEEVGEGDKQKTRVYLKLPPALAPVKAAVLPLVRKDGLPEKAKAIYDNLKMDFNVVYEEAAAIGKRYTRQDLIGTPYCIAVDHQTLEDNTVTIRHRDTMEQERVDADQLESLLNERLSFKRIFEKL